VACELVYTAKARDDIAALDAVVRKRIGKKLLMLRADPLKVSRKLVHPAIGAYRCRAGDHRVVFDLEGRRIVVLRVGHRREIYR